MNVGELKKELEKYPDNMDVFLDERLTDFRFGLLNTVSTREISFIENPDDEITDETPVVECLVLTED